MWIKCVAELSNSHFGCLFKTTELHFWLKNNRFKIFWILTVKLQIMRWDRCSFYLFILFIYCLFNDYFNSSVYVTASIYKVIHNYLIRKNVKEDELVDLEVLPAIPSDMSWATEIYHETFRQDKLSSVNICSHEVQSTKPEKCWEFRPFVLGK